MSLCQVKSVGVASGRTLATNQLPHGRVEFVGLWNSSSDDGDDDDTASASLCLNSSNEKKKRTMAGPKAASLSGALTTCAAGAGVYDGQSKPAKRIKYLPKAFQSESPHKNGCAEPNTGADSCAYQASGSSSESTSSSEAWWSYESSPQSDDFNDYNDYYHHENENDQWQYLSRIMIMRLSASPRHSPLYPRKLHF